MQKEKSAIKFWALPLYSQIFVGLQLISYIYYMLFWKNSQKFFSVNAKNNKITVPKIETVMWKVYAKSQAFFPVNAEFPVASPLMGDGIVIIT